jgi:adenylate cyclase
LQDTVTRQIAVALNIELVAAETTRRTKHPDALDYILRGRVASAKPSTRDSFGDAISMYERALVLDPSSVEAQSLLGGMLAGRAIEGMTETRAADIERAERLARQALAASPRSPFAHIARGQVLRAQDRRREAVPEFEAAIAFNHNSLGAISYLADCKLHVGPIEGVIPLVEEAIRLSPRDPALSNMYGRIAIVYLLQSRLDQAIIWSEKTRDANPARAFPHSALAAAFALKGETERAAAELAEARRLNYDFYRNLAPLRGRYSEVPEIRALFEATYGAGLRKAGMPEK